MRQLNDIEKSKNEKRGPAIFRVDLANVSPRIPTRQRTMHRNRFAVVSHPQGSVVKSLCSEAPLVKTRASTSFSRSVEKIPDVAASGSSNLRLCVLFLWSSSRKPRLGLSEPITAPLAELIASGQTSYRFEWRVASCATYRSPFSFLFRENMGFSNFRWQLFMDENCAAIIFQFCEFFIPTTEKGNLLN